MFRFGRRWLWKTRRVLVIPQEVMRQLEAYVALCPVEINGFGLVRKLTSYRFELDQVFILDQIASISRVVIPAASMSRKLDELAKDDLVPLCRLQWHSHVHAAAFFSPIDRMNIFRWRHQGPWLISLVLNKFGQHEARLDVFRYGIKIRYPVDVVIGLGTNLALDMATLEEIDRHVRIARPHNRFTRHDKKGDDHGH